MAKCLLILTLEQVIIMVQNFAFDMQIYHHYIKMQK